MACNHSHAGLLLLQAVQKLSLEAETAREEQRKRDEEAREEQKKQRESEVLSQMVLVHFRPWDGGQVVKVYTSPSKLYSSARDAYPKLNLHESQFTLYLLPDMGDFNTRVKIENEHPFSNGKLILSSPPALVLMYPRPANDQSPARIPAPISHMREDDSLKSSESSGSRDFRREVMKASSHHSSECKELWDT